MSRHGKSIVTCVAAGLAVGLALFAAPPPAGAQGIFESIFGGFQRTLPPPGAPTAIHAYSEPTANLFPAPNRPTDRIVAYGGGPATAFCVRTCDGHFFPIRAHAGLSVAQACHAFCPASETRIYSGSTIDYAVAGDGSRYANLKNAYAYRKHLIAGCTCNGRDVFGLAPIEVKDDPTLQPGDIVATEQGLVAFTGRKNRTAEFTPIASYARFSQSYRDKLAEMKIMPSNAGAPPVMYSPIPSADGKRTAQLER